MAFGHAGDGARAILTATTHEFRTRGGGRLALGFAGEARVSLHGEGSERFRAIFEDRDTGEVVYETEIGTGSWAAAHPRRVVSWRITFRNVDDPSESYVYELLLANRRVGIVNGSQNLGDSIAWMPYVEEFRQRSRCRLVYATPFRELFEKAYPEIQFVDRLADAGESGAPSIWYELRLELGPEAARVQRRPYQTVSLQEIATDLLGIPHRERRPVLAVESVPARPERPYACIATQSTAQAKYWTAEGWDRLVEHLGAAGLDVVCIDRQRVFGIDGWQNGIPAAAIDATGDRGLQERITQILGCTLFVGLSSGLAWLAWALRKPVVLVSGFTEPWNEFRTPYRVQNRDVCHGCWNDPAHVFDRDDWTWCPRHAGTPRAFECARGIPFEQVRDAVDACLRDLA